MNTFVKKGLALLLAIVMIVGFVPNLSIYADAATYTYNWGVRGEEAVALSSAAVAFYNDNAVSYESLSANAGAANTEDVPESALYEALQTLMAENHTTVNGYDAVKNYLPYTDCQDGDGIVYGFYTNTAMGSAWGEGDVSWSREHVWPNSKGLGGQDENDIMMLRPEIQSANSGRSNKAYGTSAEFYYPNTESPAGIDVRGDVARVALYQYVRWGNTEYMWGSAGVIESLEVLLDWMEADPVDTWEQGRNDAVQSITGTRNVFVDFPALAFNLFDAEVPAGLEVPDYGTLASQEVEVTYSSNGAVLSTVEATVGDQITLPAESEVTAPEGYEFVGWLATALKETETKPTVLAAGSSYTVAGEVTLHAVFSKTTTTEVEGGGSGTTTWNLVKDASQLVIGKKVVIAAMNTAVALSTTQNGNNRGQTTITKDSDNTIATPGSAVAQLTLGEGKVSGTYSFFCSAENGYLYAASSSKNYLRTEDTLSNNSSWEIEIEADGNATVKAQGSNTRNWLRHNSSSSIFATYGSGQADIVLYIETVASSGSTTVTTTTYLTHTDCDHSATTDEAAKDATCTNPGYTAGVQCTACDAFLSGHTWIAPKGHDYEATITAPTITYTCSVCGDSYQTALTDYYTVTFSVPAGVTAVDTEYVVDGTLTLPTAGTPDATYEFLGWVETELSNSTVAPATIHTADSTIDITEDTTLYALYTFTEGGSGDAEYVLVENVDQLVVGKNIVIAAKDYEFAISTTQNTNNRGQAEITKGDKVLTEMAADVAKLVLEEGGVENTYSFYCGTEGGYLYAASGSSNHLKTQDSVNANASFAITINNGEASVVAQGDNTRNEMMYNASSKLFACYGSGNTQKPLALYIETVSGTRYWTTGTCSHPNAYDEAEEPADCENPGYTAGVYCPDCDIYVSGHEVIDALGHNYEAVVTPPTATEQGYTTHTCSVCGDNYQDTFVPAVGETYTVTFWAPDYAYAPEAQEGNLTGIELPAMEAPEGYSFLGWTAARVEDATEAPVYFAAGDNYSVTADTTLYALYTYSVGGSGGTGVYEKATSETELAAGKNIVIVSAEAVEDVFYAISTNQKDNNRGAVAVTVDGNAVTLNEEVQVLTLEAGSEAGTLAFNTGDGYLYAASSSGNQLKTKAELDAKGSWNITITEGVASIVAADTGVRGTMQFNPNNGSPLFACYESASQTALAIYVEDTGSTTYFTTEIAVAVNGETAYSKVAEALDAAAATDTVELIAEAFVSEVLDIYCTLDMAGFNLNTKAVVDASTADGHIVDSVGTAVLAPANAADVKLYETNAQLAIDAANNGKLSYETVEVRQRNTVNGSVTKVSFYINKLAAETKLDDSILAGADVKIRLTVKWTEGGADKEHSFTYTDELVSQYTADWDGKMFNCSITGMEALENASVIAEVVSCGVILEASVV